MIVINQQSTFTNVQTFYSNCLTCRDCITQTLLLDYLYQGNTLDSYQLEDDPKFQLMIAEAATRYQDVSPLVIYDAIPNLQSSDIKANPFLTIKGEYK